MNFHSVGDVPLPYDLRRLTTTPNLLDRILAWLTHNGFQTLSLQTLLSHLTEGVAVPSKSLVLTFDDGYLDNWVYVHPLLKRHGHRGAIFVAGDFVQDEEIVRPTLEDVWCGRLARHELQSLGYCSWAELRAMSEAGTLEVHSHLMTHTWYPVSDRIAGFHHPQKPWYPGVWNAAPCSKPHWLQLSLEEIAEIMPWGSPVYESARSQIARRCRPDPRLQDRLAKYVAKHGGAAFFNRPDWESRLRTIATGLDRAPPEFEPADEYLRRVESESVDSRSLIEERLPGVKANFMAWPGGARDEALLALALQTYDATLTNHPAVTVYGDDPSLIHRLYFAQRSWELTGSDLPSLIHFIGRLQRHRGHGIYALHTFLANRSIEIGARLRGRRR